MAGKGNGRKGQRTIARKGNGRKGQRARQRTAKPYTSILISPARRAKCSKRRLTRRIVRAL